MKAMREVSGANGKRGIYADMTHEEKERGEGKAPFWVLRKKGPKKGKKCFVEAAGWQKKERRG